MFHAAHHISNHPEIVARVALAYTRAVTHPGVNAKFTPVAYKLSAREIGCNLRAENRRM